MKTSHLFELLLLGAIWGASFMLMKTTVDDFGVFGMVEGRALLAAIFLMPFVIIARQWSDMRLHWRKLAVVGAFNTAIPFSLFAYAADKLEVGLNAILNGTAPMFGALLAYFYLQEKIGKVGILGLITGFAGVVIISQQTHASEVALLPIATALGAACCYGIAACYIKKHLGDAKPFAIAAGSQIFSTLAILPLCLMNLPSQMPSFDAWRDLAILALICTGLAYVIYFDLIAKIGASKAITVAYLVPLFGIVWGLLLLDERLSEQTMLGGALILFGVMLTTGFVSNFLVKRRLRNS